MTQLTDVVMREYRSLADQKFGESRIFEGTMLVTGFARDSIGSSVFTKELITLTPPEGGVISMGDIYKAQLFQHGEDGTKFLGAYFKKGNPTVAHFETNDSKYVDTHPNVNWG